MFEQFYNTATNRQMVHLAEAEDLHHLEMLTRPTMVTNVSHWEDLTDLHAYATIKACTLAVPKDDIPFHVFPIRSDGSKDKQASLLDAMF